MRARRWACQEFSAQPPDRSQKMQRLWHCCNQPNTLLCERLRPLDIPAHHRGHTRRNRASSRGLQRQEKFSSSATPTSAEAPATTRAWPPLDEDQVRDVLHQGSADVHRMGLQQSSADQPVPQKIHPNKAGNRPDGTDAHR